MLIEFSGAPNLNQNLPKSLFWKPLTYEQTTRNHLLGVLEEGVFQACGTAGLHGGLAQKVLCLKCKLASESLAHILQDFKASE